MSGQTLAVRSLPAIAVLTLALATLGCSGDDAAQSTPTAACDRLVNLGNAILDVRSADSLEEVRDAVSSETKDFRAAADDSGDRRLAELSRTYEDRFQTYLEKTGIDGREAGNDASIALDRAAARCIDLGYDGEFPEQPN